MVLPPFQPLPLFRNPHVQTVVGNLFHLAREVPSRVLRVPLADDDSLAVLDSRPKSWEAGDPIVVLSHGLGGSGRSGYMQRIARTLVGDGIRAMRVNLRGAGEGASWSHRLYNAAGWPDLRNVLEVVHRQHPDSPLILAGFSLSGNIVLGLAGAGTELAGLIGVVSVAPPIDLERCSYLIAQFPWYDRYYARRLVAQVRRQQRLVPGLPSVHFPRGLTIRHFDEIYTAPRSGFADALDYYRRASARPVVSNIMLPTFILTARDDPFVAAASFDDVQLGPRAELEIVDHGGHLGFLGWDGVGGIRWAERRVVDWIVQQFRSHCGSHG